MPESTRVIRCRIPALPGYYRDAPGPAPTAEEVYHLARNLVRLMQAYLQERYPAYRHDVALTTNLRQRIPHTPDTVPPESLEPPLAVVRGAMAAPTAPWAAAIRVRGADVESLLPQILALFPATPDAGA